jgi:hypothetical protein
VILNLLVDILHSLIAPHSPHQVPIA